MDALALINRYYPEENELKQILLTHSHAVAHKALEIADKNSELKIDKDFLIQGALLHDIGIFMTDAPRIQCFGTHPYICHGYLGADLLRQEGFELYARVCERHTGAGISLPQIIERELPLPQRQMVPISIEEEIICFADKFFSKTNLKKEKSVDEAIKSIEKHGDEGVNRFKTWCKRFL
ncbi:MAG: HDIG domain-containing metalloprotein [Phocaeicola sp.]